MSGLEPALAWALELDLIERQRPKMRAAGPAVYILMLAMCFSLSSLRELEVCVAM